MLDLETMGTRAGAAIISIGAVLFDPRGNEVVGQYYQVIDHASCVKYGLKIDPDTILWWMRQSDAARGALCNPSIDRVDLKEALVDFACWLPSKGVRIWGNGSDFDNTILGAAYDAVGMPQPWNFWNNRCYRTVKNMKPSVELERVGTYHNALDDAKSQAIHLQKILGGRS